MAKNAIITIELVSEAEGVNSEKLRNEILKSLQCDWLSKVLSVNMNSEEL
jgi:hypothetical protein